MIALCLRGANAAFLRLFSLSFSRCHCSTEQLVPIRFWGKESSGSGPQWITEALCLQIFSSTQSLHPNFFYAFVSWLDSNTSNYSLSWLDAVEITSGKLIWDNHHSEPKPAFVRFIRFASEDTNHSLLSDAASHQVLNPTYALF